MRVSRSTVEYMLWRNRLLADVNLKVGRLIGALGKNNPGELGAILWPETWRPKDGSNKEMFTLLNRLLEAQ